MKIARGGVKYCSSCFGQYLDREHIDFESMFDGPAIKQDNGDYHYIGDLIICSRCLENAGALIGMYPAEGLKKENEELGEALENKNQENDALRKAYVDVEQSLESLSNEKIKKRSAKKPVRQPKVAESIGIINGGA